MAEQIKMLFGVNTPGSPRNIVLDGDPDPPQTGGRDLLLNLGLPCFSGTAEATDSKFCLHVEGHNENFAKLGHRGSGQGHVTYFCDRLHISRTATARKSCTCRMCDAFDAVFAKLFCPLVIFPAP